MILDVHAFQVERSKSTFSSPATQARQKHISLLQISYATRQKQVFNTILTLVHTFIELVAHV